MTESFGQNGLWDESDLGPRAEPTPRTQSRRVRAVRHWTADSATAATPDRPVRAPERAVRALAASNPSVGTASDFQSREEAQAAQANSGPGDDTRPRNLVYPLLPAANRITVGDTVWYRGRAHIVRDVSKDGAFDFCVTGVCPPYYGLASIESTVTKMGRRNSNGKLIEHGVTPHPYYTELDGERIGWVSYLLCQIEKTSEGERDEQEQKRVWWARPRRRSTPAF